MISQPVWIRTSHAITQHLREGSTGAELLSATYKITLAITYISGHANPGSTLFPLIAGFWFGPWFLVLLGLVHIIAWTQPSRLPWIGLRKACSVVGFAIWTSILYDLIHMHVTALIILILPMVIFLGVAIVRRKYVIT